MTPEKILLEELMELYPRTLNNSCQITNANFNSIFVHILIRGGRSTYIIIFLIQLLLIVKSICMYSSSANGLLYTNYFFFIFFCVGGGGSSSFFIYITLALISSSVLYFWCVLLLLVVNILKICQLQQIKISKFFMYVLWKKRILNPVNLILFFRFFDTVNLIPFFF